MLLRSHAGGDGMWRAERSRGDFALMRVALSSFGSGRDAAPRSARLPDTWPPASQSSLAAPLATEPTMRESAGKAPKISRPRSAYRGRRRKGP